MLDTSIPLQVRPPQFDNPVDAASKVMMLKHLALQGQMQESQLANAARQQQEQQTLADIYKRNTQQDGTPNHSGIVNDMASSGVGHLIPGYRKTMLDADKDQTDIDYKKSQTQAEQYKVAKQKLDVTGGAINSLLQNPNVTHQDVINTIVSLNQQDLVDGKTGQAMVQALPSNPADLRGFLMQKGLEVMDASKRMEMLTPRFEKIDNGGAVVMGTVDPLTGQFKQGQAMQKVATPDARLSSQTQLTTTGMNNATTQRGQDLNFRTQNVHIEQTPTGLVAVNKQNLASAPIMAGPGVQVQQKDSPLWKAGQMQGKLKASIDAARELIPHATNSGLGAMVDKGAGFVGAATPGAEAAGQLETIGGWMTSNVPRMEGPQSDKDTLLYRQMAAQVGDRTVPASVRLKALDTLEELQTKYKSLNTDPYSGVPANVAPAANKARPPLSAFQK